MEKQTFADITAEQIQDWKAKHGKNSLSQATVTTEDGEYNFILCKPGRSVLEAVAKDKTDNGNKIMLANCVLGGDTYAIEQDAAVYLAVVEQIGLLFTSAKASLKKI